MPCVQVIESEKHKLSPKISLIVLALPGIVTKEGSPSNHRYIALHTLRNFVENAEMNVA